MRKKNKKKKKMIKYNKNYYKTEWKILRKRIQVFTNRQKR